MRYAICDFCKTTSGAVPRMLATPTDWIEWKILAKGHVVQKDLLMCNQCIEERKIEIRLHSSPTIADVVLDEISDGIRDIVQDEVGER